MQKALSRLVQSGAVCRVANGVFMRPEKSPYVSGDVPADLTKVVKAIAERTGATVQMHGAEAAVRMGLTTQVPMQAIFQTSGPTRQIKVGARNIRLQRVSTRKLALAGRPAGIALTALWYLGKQEVLPSTFEKISRKLGATEFKALTGARAQMPGWMVKVLDRYVADHGIG